MKRGFYTIMAAQFFSSLADNALLIASIALLLEMQGPAWMTPLLKFFFTVSYVLLAPFVGAFLTAIWLAARPTFRNAGATLLWSVAGFGVCMIIFGLSQSLWLSLLVLGVSGALDNISVVIRHVLVQLRTPDEMRGRTSAVNAVFIESSNELGAFESGLVAREFSPMISVVSGGVGTLAVVALVAFAFPALRAMRRIDETSEDVRRAEFEEEEHRRLGNEG